MSIIVQQGQTLLLATIVVVGSLYLQGCDGDSGTEPGGGGGCRGDLRVIRAGKTGGVGWYVGEYGNWRGNEVI